MSVLFVIRMQYRFGNAPMYVGAIVSEPLSALSQYRHDATDRPKSPLTELKEARPGILLKLCFRDVQPRGIVLRFLSSRVFRCLSHPNVYNISVRN